MHVVHLNSVIGVVDYIFRQIVGVFSVRVSLAGSYLVVRLVLVLTIWQQASVVGISSAG